ncbi:MAG: hypothetical protein ACRCZO_07080, partial [Cetobacterium sp.]
MEIYKINIKFNDFFMKKDFEDGVYHIKITENQSLDILIHNFSNKSLCKSKILVGFSGAVSNRLDKCPPFFSGKGISESLNLPLVSFSDPTLELSEDLNLAWYAGNIKIKDLPKKISQILNYIANLYNSKLIIFGGSGGGFASIVQANFLKVPTRILVWNPQVNIDSYIKKAVDKYYDIAQIDKNFEDNWLLKNLNKLKIRENSEIIYMQNKSDWHYKLHYETYLQGMELEEIGEVIKINKKDRIYFYEGNWGEGHAPLPLEIVKRILKDMSLDKKCLDILFEVHNKIEKNKKQKNEELIIRIIGNSYEFKVNTDEKEVFYAFYLYKDGERIDLKWYSKEKSYKIDLKNSGKYKIKYFIKQRDEIIKTGYFNDIIIEKIENKKESKGEEN